MSQDMSSSWRYLSSASSRLSYLKGYIRDPGASLRPGRSTPQADTDERQSWRAWAGQKIRVKRRGGYDPSNTEIVNLFPGWAARRYNQNVATHDFPTPFEVEVFVSGYAISYRPPENASRSQRAFIRLAKGFASLPKLVENAGDLQPNMPSLAHLTPSTEELLASVKLPPRPTEITDDFDVDALERQLKEVNDGDSSDSSSISSSTYEFDPSSTSKSEDKRPHIIEPNSPVEVLRRLHANLEKRLQPFWSSVLPNHVVRLHLFASPHGENTTFDSVHGPLASQDVYTAADGSFQARFRVKWEDLCQHPRALHIAFGESVEEHELLVVAQLLPPPSMANTPSSTASYGHARNYSMPNPSSHSQHPSTPPQPSTTPLASLTRIPITDSPIRVISDIDDTVKLSGVLSGARAVFHNVFVKDLRDNVIPGMGEWYADMWSRGVRFHYVSNGPFEILPVLNEFFQISQLPPGSIKLRSYAGRSLFNGLLSAPAARKRAGVVDVLDSFPDSRFFLIGDTGEQDLELYADLARERPTQVLGVFLRDADASTFEGPLPLDDPTGWNAMGAAGTRSNERPLVSRRESSSSEAPSSGIAGSYWKYFGYGDKKTKTPDECQAVVAPESEHETPKPDRYMMNSTQRNCLDDEALARAIARNEPQTYSTHNPLHEEPLPLPSTSGQLAGASATPNPLSTARMEPSTSNTSTINASQAGQSSLGKTYITQPPNSTPPPSIQPSSHAHASHRHRFCADPSSASFRSQQTGSSTSSSASSSNRRTVSEAEKKRQDLQMRVYRARTQMPSHVPLRVFREPQECVEVQEILDREGREGQGEYHGGTQNIVHKQ